MKERSNSEQCHSQFDFSFLKNEPHSNINEIMDINGGIHLVNHVLDHRWCIFSSIEAQSAILECSDKEKRIATLIIKELERVAGSCYTIIPEQTINLGIKEVNLLFDEMLKPITEKLMEEPGMKEKTNTALEELRKINPV